MKSWKTRLFGAHEVDAKPARACEGKWARDCLAAGDGWKKPFDPKFYYEQTRQEIVREDNITNQRLTWAVSMQAFLMAAVVYLIASAWPAPYAAYLAIITFREITLGAVGCTGLAAAWITFEGVRASREHIHRVKEDWEMYNAPLEIVPEMAPHTFGHGPTIAFGSKYALLIPIVMFIAWAFYLAAYALVLGRQLGSNLLCIFFSH